MAQKGYLRNGPIEVWHWAADFRMFLYHGHRNEARRHAVGPGPQVHASQRRSTAQVVTTKEWGYMWITDWTARAACKGTDPDELFVQGAAQNRAKLICRGCPVRTECLADALDNRIEFGVWGGMTERERRALLRRRPDVRSWRELLEQARNTYERGTEELVAS
jgi:WhiB family transcriptional regulator, redox-sensing transcriptional regulator